MGVPELCKGVATGTVSPVSNRPLLLVILPRTGLFELMIELAGADFRWCRGFSLI
jgi:hypothetical protein